MTRVSNQPPAKFAHEEGDGHGRAVNSVVSNGVIVSGGLIRDSVLSPGVRVDGRCRVNRAVILHNTHVHRRAVVENAILDKDVTVLAAPPSGWTRNTTAPAGSPCRRAASPWSARDRWWRRERPASTRAPYWCGPAGSVSAIMQPG